MIVGDSFQVRTVSYGPFIRGHFYHISLTAPYSGNTDLYAFGENLQYNDRVLYLEEGDCPEGGFMEFVVDKVHLFYAIKAMIISSGLTKTVNVTDKWSSTDF